MKFKRLTRLLTAAAVAGTLSLWQFAPAQDEEEPATDQQEVAEMEDAEAAPPEEETPKVEATVEELQALINLPPGAQLGPLREADEDPTDPTAIFEDTQKIQELLGEKPRFIYYPEGVDPMIIPWVRNQIVAQELWDEAQVAKKAQDYDRAMEILQRLESEYQNTAEGAKAEREIATVRDLMREDRPAVAAVPERGVGPEVPQIVLPQQIYDSTTAVWMIDQPKVLVQEELVGIGDTVPEYPSVRVKSIEPSRVVYEYQDQDFPIQINPYQ